MTPEQSPSATFSESFKKAFDELKPDGLEWSRVEAALSPKAPEPESTEEQKFWRDMYRSGKLSPYQKDRPGINAAVVAEAWKNPQSQGTDSKIMAVDLALRGGADKEYNQLGDMSKRATRMAVMAGNMVPNIAADIALSIPPNLLIKAFDEHWKSNFNAIKQKVKEERQSAEGITPQTQTAYDVIARKVGAIKMLGRVGDVMNDKNVTAIGNTIQRQLTGEKGWFTGEASDKLNDLLTFGFADRIEDFANGPAIESAFRITYQVPVFGALVEQMWTRWTNFQSSSEYSKGNLKAIYAGVGMFIGILRDVDGKGHHTPSWWLTDKTWNLGKNIAKSLQGVKPAPSTE